MRVEAQIRESGERIDKVLAALFPEFTRSALQKLIEQGAVTVDGVTVNKKYNVSAGQSVCIDVPEPEPLDAPAEDIPLDIVYEDDSLMVINKPKGMVVHPAPGHYTGTLVNALLFCRADSLSGINGVLRPGIVHRLDMDTSGLIIVAKNDKSHKALADMIKAHDFVREYEAVVIGTPSPETGTVNAPLARDPKDRKRIAVCAGGREAITHYSVLRSYRGYSHVRLRLETGRTHQIRVHMAHIGHPVVCDEVYGGRRQQFACCKGQCLHSVRIAFRHPETGEMLDISTRLPEYFNCVLDSLSTLD